MGREDLARDVTRFAPPLPAQVPGLPLLLRAGQGPVQEPVPRVQEGVRGPCGSARGEAAAG